MKSVGLQPTSEPFTKLFTQGMVTHATFKSQDGRWLSPDEVALSGASATELASGAPAIIGPIEKMSKSKRNTVDPDDIVATYGADVARLFVLSDSPPERDVEWSESGVEGSWRFVQKIWAAFDALPEGSPGPMTIASQATGPALDLRRAAHKAIAAMSLAIDTYRFNSAIANLHELVGHLRRAEADTSTMMLAARVEALGILARLLQPFTPHLAEEAWTRMGGDGFVSLAPWPQADESLLAEATIMIPVQVDGKKRGELHVAKSLSKAELEAMALNVPEAIHFIAGRPLDKVIVVPDRIVNIVTRIS
jgi:leucyl-tRNA synthetase